MLDQLDQQLVDTIAPERINQFVESLNSTDSCELIDIEMATIDPRWAEIHDQELKDLFSEIHRIIINDGVDLVSKVNNVYEFAI